MPDNKRLVPTCIVYVDGARLDTVCEGAFRAAKVFDLLDKIGECTVAFDWLDLGAKTPKCFPFLSSLSVCLGYKDDMEEVFSGEITAQKILHPEYGPSRYSVKASSLLQRLGHGEHRRTFYDRTPSQAIKDTLERYNLKAECDAFGPQRPYWQGGQETDWKLALRLAKQYGKDIYCCGDKVYVKELMAMHKGEHIYEWGKSLIDFRVKENIDGMPEGVRAIGWDIRKATGFKALKTLEDLGQKIGGRTPWTKLVEAHGNRTHNVYDHSLADAREAEELALGLLRERSFKFMRAEGRCEGDAGLRAGATVAMKGLGPAWNGEYIAEAVVHDFSMEEGYITEFHLKRNMMDDEFAKKSTGGTGDTGAGKYAGANAEDNSEEEEEEEKEDGPEFRRLVWKKDGMEVSEALIDDDLTLFCEVKNIGEGEKVKFKIFEQGESRDDAVDEAEGEVADGKVEAPWKVAYKGDEGSSTEEEIEEQGWTVPDYYFVAEYGGVESGGSKKLDAKGWITRQIIDKETGELLINHDYALLTSEGKLITGQTDGDGYIKLKGIKIGKFSLIT